MIENKGLIIESNLYCNNSRPRRSDVVLLLNRIVHMATPHVPGE